MIGSAVATESSTVPRKICVPSGVTMVADGGENVKVEAKRRTVIARWPVAGLAVAMMFVVPSASAVASPLPATTLATPGAELDQPMDTPPMMFACESRATAVYCLVRPVVRSVSEPVELTTIEATTCVTEIGARPVLLAAVATAVSAAPTARAVARPPALTLAVAPVPARVQVAAGAPDTAAPEESTTAAVSSRVDPIAPKATVAGVTFTAATT